MNIKIISAFKKILIVTGLAVGVHTLYRGIVSHKLLFMLHGIIIILLSLIMLKESKLVRILAILFCAYIYVTYAILLYITAINQWHYGYMVGLVAHFLPFIWCVGVGIYVIISSVGRS